MMFKRVAMCAVAALAIGGSIVTHAQKGSMSVSKVQQEVGDATRAFVAAYGANDVEKYFSYYAKDITIYRVTGRFNRQTYHDYWTKTVADGGGNSWTRTEDLKIQVLPGNEAAIATFDMPTGRRFANPEAAKGQAPSINYHFTAVWEHRGDHWEIVHAHYTVHTDPAPGSPFTKERNPQ
jgi:ketosteroid isomerase-like protein